jgi:tRNA threonylcarbamoyladenosine biosynthesis protein TsaE
MKEFCILIETDVQMQELAGKLYQCLQSSPHRRAVIFLQGNLGAGKTTFVRGFLRSVPYAGHVKSPTYTLMEPYNLDNVDIYHLDLYRVSEPAALEEIGLRDLIDDDAYFLVEWPIKDKAALFVPDIDVKITFERDHRMVTLKATSKIGQDIVQALS